MALRACHSTRTGRLFARRRCPSRAASLSCEELSVALASPAEFEQDSQAIVETLLLVARLPVLQKHLHLRVRGVDRSRGPGTVRSKVMQPLHRLGEVYFSTLPSVPGSVDP